MSEFKVGDRVAMLGVPGIVVTVTGFARCEEGERCPLGLELFSFQDPGGLGEDWMHCAEFRKVEEDE